MKRFLILLSMIALAVGSAIAQTRDQEIERLRVENAWLKAGLDTSSKDIPKLFAEAGVLYEQGKWHEAKERMIRAYAAFERLPVQNKTKRILCLRFLCNISNRLQENDKTIEYATALKAHALTNDDRGFAYFSLGSAYKSKGAYDEAIVHFGKSLAIRLKTLGPEHPNVATCYGNLGAAYDDEGNYDRAIWCHEKALAILRHSYPEHPSIATSYNNLGSAHDHKGAYDKAIAYYERAQVVYLKSLGSDHPLVALSYSNIGAACGAKGAYDEAIVHLGKSLAIQLKTLPPEHPDIAKGYFNFGMVYAKKDDQKNAMTYLLRAKAIFLKRFGPEHPHTKLTQAEIDKLK